MKSVSIAATKPAATGSKLAVTLIALISLYIFWGGTYLGMKVAIETIPPFIMAGVRFLMAGTILYFVARIKGDPRPSRLEWRGAGIVGALLLLGGNGVVAWAEQRVPSAIASLLVATVPLWIIMFNWLGGSRKKPNTGVILGVVSGFLGIAVLVLHSGGSSDQGMDVVGILALLFASISWSIGSLYSRTAKLPDSPLLSTALQMIVGGILLIVLSLFLEDWSALHLSDISLRSYLAFGYLVLFGAIVGYTAYIWLLKNADPTWVSTYAFVNPMVAVALGWFIAGEQLPANSLISAVLIITAVIVITVYGKKQKG
ncbi:EamA family transporter [Paenibacillus sp. sgz500958]|uniref:EamA family transporter n=1 Tax=Paenibacillus sp. sgz500958 TaxID=3242475 RepID=UPI0036D3A250